MRGVQDLLPGKGEARCPQSSLETGPSLSGVMIGRRQLPERALKAAQDYYVPTVGWLEWGLGAGTLLGVPGSIRECERHSYLPPTIPGTWYWWEVPEVLRLRVIEHRCSNHSTMDV